MVELSTHSEAAVSLDLDGVVFKRFPFQFKAIWRRHLLRKGVGIYLPPAEIPEMVREEVTDRLRPAELPNFIVHMVRRVPEEVKSAILSLYGIGFDIYGNTGRSSRGPWVNMTMASLERHGVLDYFLDVFFKPEGFKTRDSKINAVAKLRERYERVVHFDDNPEDALPMAELFPDVKLVIVQDKSTGLLYSREEALRYHNVTRVITFQQGARSLASLLSTV